MLRVKPWSARTGDEGGGGLCFFCYYQHDYLRDLSVFLSETWARALRVLRWKSSGIQVLCETECSASGSHVGVVAKREKVQSLGDVVFVATKTN